MREGFNTQIGTGDEKSQKRSFKGYAPSSMENFVTLCVYCAAVKKHDGDPSHLLEKVANEFKFQGAPKAAGHVSENTPATPSSGTL